MKHNSRFLTVFLLIFSFVIGSYSIETIVSAAAREPSASSAPVIAQIATQAAGTVVPQASAAALQPTVITDPTRLAIPNARVDATIIPVGVTKTNNLDVPPNFVQVGWYEYGPKAGQVGNTVLDGHVDNGGSIDGVFKHLRDLKPGDDVYVTGADGAQLHYKVDHSDVYLTTQFPSGIVFNENNGQPTLKIITCHGTFVPSTGTYDHRLVVTAYLVQ